MYIYIQKFRQFKEKVDGGVLRDVEFSILGEPCEKDTMADGQEDNKHLDSVNIEAKSSKKTFDNSEYVLRKRPPYVFAKKRNDFYATNKTPFKAQLNICEKLLDEGEPEIIIHGLGAAINRACSLALELKKNSSGTLEIDIRTSTVSLTDDLEPMTDSVDYEVNDRNNSAIHIRVFRTVVIGPLKFAS